MPKSSYEHLSGRLDANDIGLGWLDGITVLESVKAVSTRPHAHMHTEVIFCLKGELSYRIADVGEGPSQGTDPYRKSFLGRYLKIMSMPREASSNRPSAAETRNFDVTLSPSSVTTDICEGMGAATHVAAE